MRSGCFSSTTWPRRRGPTGVDTYSVTCVAGVSLVGEARKAVLADSAAAASPSHAPVMRPAPSCVRVFLSCRRLRGASVHCSWRTPPRQGCLAPRWQQCMFGSVKQTQKWFQSKSLYGAAGTLVTLLSLICEARHRSLATLSSLM